jgi:hypothetical protein
MRLRQLLTIAFFLLSNLAIAQVRGGERAFEFLRLSNSPHISALGGLSVINPAEDVMMSTANPALLRPSFHTNLGLNYNLYYAGTKVTNMYYAHHVKKLNTTFGLGIQYLNYGDFTTTNTLGQVLGQAQAVDYALTLTASRSYLEKWRYGASVKLANSQLINEGSFALLMDVGIAYADTVKQLYAGLAVKNAGYQLDKYTAGVAAQPLPLDVQLGVMKKFNKAPFAISVLAHHLYQWDIRYDNPADQQDNILIISDTTASTEEKSYFADKLFRHFVFALDMSLGKRLEVSAGYNHLRRSELALAERKGVSGFSYGAGLYLNKFTIHFARSHYHLAGAFNQVGFNFQMNKFFGLGKNGRKINWSDTYANSY